MKISEAYELCRVQHIRMNGYSESAFKRYGYHKKAAVEFFNDKVIENINLEDIRKYYDWVSIGRRNNTIRCYMGTLKQVFKYARLIGVNCVDSELIPVAKEDKVEMPYASPNEVGLFIDAAFGVRNKFIISFLYASGCRISEFVSLNRDSIQNRSFKVKGKGGKIRLCFIDERTERLMNEYLASRNDRHNALVVSRQNNRLSVSSIQLMVRNINNRIGVTKKITPHSFRHGFVTNLLKNGTPIQDVAQLAGHSHVNTTMIYYHNDNPSLRRTYNLNHTF